MIELVFIDYEHKIQQNCAFVKATIVKFPNKPTFLNFDALFWML